MNMSRRPDERTCLRQHRANRGLTQKWRPPVRCRGLTAPRRSSKAPSLRSDGPPFSGHGEARSAFPAAHFIQRVILVATRYNDQSHSGFLRIRVDDWVGIYFNLLNSCEAK